MTAWRKRLSRLVIHVPTQGLPSSSLWYLAGGVPAANCIGAYESLLAASLADSYNNLANPGTYDLTTTAAPSWDALGWKGNGSDQFLDTGITPAQNWSFYLLFSEAPQNAWAGGSFNNPTWFGTIPYTATNTVSYQSGGALDVAPQLVTGSIAVAGQQGYRNGTANGDAIAASWDPALNTAFQLLKLGGYAGGWFSGRIQRFSIYNIVLTAAQVYKIHTKKTAIDALFLGDSIAAGSMASEAAHRWANQVAADRGWTVFRNAGRSANVLQNTVQNTVATIGAAADYNVRDNFASELARFKPKYVFNLTGLNDIRLNDAAFTAANYQTDLGQMVDSIIISGVPAANIVLGSPPYMNPTKYSWGPPYDGGSTEKHEDYRDATAAVATAKGTKYKDIYQYMLDNGDDDLLDADGIHPNDSGYDAITTAFLSVL